MAVLKAVVRLAGSVAARIVHGTKSRIGNRQTPEKCAVSQIVYASQAVDSSKPDPRPSYRLDYRE